MGGLFSREETQPPPPRVIGRPPFQELHLPAGQRAAPPPSQQSPWNYNHSEYTPRPTPYISQPVYSVYQPAQQQRKPSTPQLALSVLDNKETENWVSNSVDNVYSLIELDSSDIEYMRVSSRFIASAPKHFRLIAIKRVENPYLFGCYLLKREELKLKESINVKIKDKYCYHGTAMKNVDSICKHNFDWRLHGVSLGNRFGQGISFSPSATYSSHYCDKGKLDPLKVMFVVRVPVLFLTEGTKDTIVPPKNFDTAQKPGGNVIVKFSDSEFYPEYIIYFKGTPIKYKNQNQ